MFKIITLTLLLLSVVGCSTKGGIRTSDLAQIRYGKIAESQRNILDNYSYRLDYLINSNFYQYNTYINEDTKKYYVILTENSHISSVVNTNVNRTYWPEIRKCTSFPHNPEIDTLACLDKITKEVKNRKISLAPSDISTVDAVQEEKLSKEKTGAIVEASIIATLAAPMIVPAAIISTPLAISDASSNDLYTDLVALGSNIEELANVIAKIPNNMKSIENGKGSFLIGKKVNLEPVYAVGVENNIVVWITPTPKWSCKRKFFGNYYDCEIWNNN